MFLPDKKKAASIILSRMSGGKEKTTEAAPTEQVGVKDDAYTSMAEDLLQALEAKSVPDIAEVLESVCQYMQATDDDADSGE